MKDLSRNLVCKQFLVVTLFFICSNTFGSGGLPPVRIVVDINGKGDYKSIQGALNSLPDTASEARVIFIKKGTYNEKIYIEKHNIILLGDERTQTIITQAIAREEWTCMHAEDWGVATLNVDADDITFQNLTVINSFGYDFKNEVTIECPRDTVTRRKTITRFGHQMTLRTMNATRLKAINCHFISFAGDTVSPWNVEKGMFYFKDCIMEGGVDFYCPRGWAYAENCHFKVLRGEAAIWHDGSRHPESKTVLNNCSFEGFDGFKLGRYHRDAQFYLVNCVFPKNMADTGIYRAASSPGVKWGHRVYYFNCHREGGDYSWFKDNLQSAPGSPLVEKINAGWTFAGKWQPEKSR